MNSRRWFLRRLGLAAGGLAVAGSLRDRMGSTAAESRLPVIRPARGGLAAADAAAIRVSPGRSLPVRIPGVRIEYLRLRMPDGIHLAATLYLPETVSAAAKVPAILEVLPYRKDDDYLLSDLDRHGYYARHGYAGLRLDVRGTGASEGFPKDEYSVEEHEDTLHVIDWLSKQPWCNGSVGMTGISYGAFNSVQIAAMNPPALKAIAAAAGTDDRYTDDVHYFGGAMHLFENTWSVAMVAANVMPAAPDFDVRTQAARDRFDTPPWYMRWIREQTDGPYWRRGSLRPDYGRLKIPTFLMGGWLDGYHNFVPRIMRHAPAITKGLVGPWPHSYPDDPHPGPQIDFRAQMLLPWWDQWLKGRDTGILDQPRVTSYAMRWFEPSLRLAELQDVPGEWRHLDAWPESAFAPPERRFLVPDPRQAALRDDASDAARPGRGGRLAESSGRGAALDLKYRPGVGTRSKTWAPNGDGTYGMDQRQDDVYGLSFDSEPLQVPLEILGFPKARLFVSATAPVANWIVRLCDLAPDGTSHYVSKGVLNGTHRGGHTAPEPLVPGEVYEIEVELHCTGWIFDRAHRIRVVVVNADWPVVWPSPHAMTTTLHCGGDRPSHIDLPVWTGRSLPGPEFRRPPAREYPIEAESRDTPFGWQVTRDEAGQAQTFRLERGWEITKHPAGITAAEGQVFTARVEDRNPAAAALEVESFYRGRSRGRTVEARGEGSLRSTGTEFLFDVTCTLLENGRTIRRRRWQDRAPRRLV
ncbi:MAG TPA: CocE/NonD family hydrolase [Candidatus Polarisedimenticolia bacterium]|nr:CocE/NonD family hydrolase [Candidatus Polarisedimenticolia bacterium]